MRTRFTRRFEVAYIDVNTLWRFTVPQAGEVDSAESVERMMVEIDDALIGPMAKAELTANGAALNANDYTDGSTSKYSTSKDSYWSAQEGRNIYVTRRHYHPTPNRVPNADNATNASHAANADHASNADNAANATHASQADNATNASHAANADRATRADRATNADYATRAGYLSPGFKLNGITITGKPTSGSSAPSHTIKLNDIPDSTRVFWGTREPSGVTSFPTLRRGDLYVKII